MPLSTRATRAKIIRTNAFITNDIRTFGAKNTLRSSYVRTNVILKDVTWTLGTETNNLRSSYVRKNAIRENSYGTNAVSKVCVINIREVLYIKRLVATNKLYLFQKKYLQYNL